MTDRWVTHQNWFNTFKKGLLMLLIWQRPVTVFVSCIKKSHLPWHNSLKWFANFNNTRLHRVSHPWLKTCMQHSRLMLHDFINLVNISLFTIIHFHLCTNLDGNAQICISLNWKCNSMWQLSDTMQLSDACRNQCTTSKTWNTMNQVTTTICATT